MNPASKSPAPPPARSGSPAWRRRLPWVGAATLAVLIVIGLWPAPVPVEVSPVRRGPLVVTVDEEGMTRVKNRYVITAPVAGQLRRIDWKAGAGVEAGRTVLAVIESGGADFLDARLQVQAEARVKAASAAREAAQAQRARAESAARFAAAENARARGLREERVISAQEADLARTREETTAADLRAADFSVQVAGFELQQAEALLSRGRAGGSAEPLVLVAPVSGRILRVMQESARMVSAGFPLLEVGDPADLEVRIEVLSRDGVAIQPGARVMLEQWGGAEPLAARVRLVEPSAFTKISALGVEEQRVYVIADFTDPVAKRPTLGDSYRVEARVVTWESPSALQAPAGALFRRSGEWRVFVVEGGRAVLRTVQPGRSNGVQTEIIGGLREGDQAIIYPGDKVGANSRVRSLVVNSN